MTFKEMTLSAPIQKAIAAQGYEIPTPIQEQTIPHVLNRMDVMGLAQTGTGKTAAFALPILQLLSLERVNKRFIRSLILTPTRELALQIYESFLAYGKGSNIVCTAVFGGVGQKPQTDALRRGVDVLVATPGRLNDLCNQGFIKLGEVQIFVLDEADRMLDMGFKQDVQKVLKMLPANRQTLFFSATMPKEVESLAMSMLKKPVTVKVDPVSSTVDTIEQHLYMIDKVNKKNMLIDILRKPDLDSALVFVRTRHGADKVYRDLIKANIPCRSIHGDKSQFARQEALNAFKRGTVKALIATDIAARGLDISGLSHVINFDVPNEPEAYVHRIGRTGRAGNTGKAITFCCIDEVKPLAAIEKLIKLRIPREECPYPMQVFEPTIKQPRPPRPQNGTLPKKLTMSGKAVPTHSQPKRIGRKKPDLRNHRP